MQSDLFELSSQSIAAAEPEAKVAFLERTRVSLRLDQLVVGLIALLVMYVLIFSYGVENGKRFAMAELRAERAKREQMVSELTRQLFDLRQSSAEASLPALNKTAAPVLAVALAPIGAAPAAVVTPGKQFTIQMVTYASQKPADEATKKLAGAGHKGYVIPSGKFFLMCVDLFPTREKAGLALKEFKTAGLVPADAYVRAFPQ